MGVVEVVDLVGGMVGVMEGTSTLACISCTVFFFYHVYYALNWNQGFPLLRGQ